ncbi:MAG: class I SAM-dependent methyltransferase [Actinomycetota bacterium]
MGHAPPDAVVLDLGAGEAEFRTVFARGHYYAIDRGIGHSGWDYSNLDVVADATKIPFKNESFDFIVCKQVLEHIPEPVVLLEEAHRVLKSGGRIILSTNQSWPQHQQPHDFFRFTSFGLSYCFQTAGLEIETMQAMGGAFTAALFHFSQTLAPHLWVHSKTGWRIFLVLTKPIAWILRLCAPVANFLDRKDKTKDNTLGWYVLARRR